MGRRKCTFRESDLRRALQAARSAGVKVKIEIADGKLTVLPIDNEGNSEPTDDGARNPWDDVA